MGLSDISAPHRVPILERLARDGEGYAMFALSRVLPRGPGGKETRIASQWRRRAERTSFQARLARLEAVPRLRWAGRPAPTLLAWAREAARSRHPVGMHAVAWRQPDRRRIRAGLARAADAGSAAAAFFLATHVETLAGDLRVVRRWLRRAVVLGMHEEWAENVELLVTRAVPYLRGFAAAPADWMRRARVREPEALVHLGYARRFGRGTRANPAASRRAFIAAADAGSAEAGIALTLSFFDPGACLDLDDVERWAEVGATSPDPLGGWLGSEWGSGETSAQQRRADRWLRRAAKAGEVHAALALARRRRDGRWVRQDSAQALRWARVAAVGGHEGAMAMVARLLEGKARPTPSERREAAQWRRRAAACGDYDDWTNWGVRLHEGRGVRRDDREAVRWYRRAAAHGCPSATANLGRCYRHGHGVRKSPRLAVRWFRRAGEVFGSAQAALCLGSMYRKGELGRPDVKNAFVWYRRAAAMGDPEGLRELGIAYHEGFGIEQDHDFAALLYRAAAEAGDGWAAYCLAQCYRDGEGVRRSRRSAERWFRVAIERDVKPAKKALQRLRVPGQKGVRR